MPTQMFQLDDDQLRRLAKLYRRMPKAFRLTVSRVLNSQAFGTRKEAFEIIEQRMTVRSPRFIRSSIRVQKARGHQPLSQQHSLTGSISRERFSGLREQETGEDADRTRVATAFGRGGGFSKKVRPALRLRKANQFTTPNDFPGQSDEHRVIVMLNVLQRQKFRRAFLIFGHRKFKAGLYQFRGRRLRMVQNFEPDNPNPARVRWLSGARKQYFRETDIRLVWIKQLNLTLRGQKL